MSSSNAEKATSNKLLKSQDESCSKKTQADSLPESGEVVNPGQVVQLSKPDSSCVSDETESGKQPVKNKGSSSEVDEKVLSGCQVSIQRCQTSSKHKKDETQDGREEDFRQDTKRKSRKCKQASKTNAPRGKGRRFIFKKNVAKTPVASSIPVTVESLMYDGQYWQVGDIVSVKDVDGGVYYCQVRGLLQDQYCEKSAALTWLLPTIYSPPQAERFDPATYIIGQEEEIPRKMEYLTFVCHAPSDYYKLQNSPYPTSSNLSNAAHVWASMKPVDVKSSRFSFRNGMELGMGNSLCFQRQRHIPRRRDQYRPTCKCPCDRTNGPFHPYHETLHPYKRHHFKEPRLKPVPSSFEVDYGWKFSSGIPQGMPGFRPVESRWSRPSRYPLRKDIELVREQEQRDFRPELLYDLQRPYVSSRNAFYSAKVKQPIHYIETSQPRSRRKYDFRIKQDYAPQRGKVDANWMEARRDDTGSNFYGSEIHDRNDDDKESLMRPLDSAANNLLERETAPLAKRVYPPSPVDLSSRLNGSRGSRVEHIQHEPEFEQMRIPGSSDAKSNLQCSQLSRPPEPWSDGRRDSALSGLRRSKGRVQFQEFKQVNHIYPPSLEVELPSRRVDVSREIRLPHFPAEGDEHSDFRHSGQEHSYRTRFWHRN